MDELVVGFI